MKSIDQKLGEQLPSQRGWKKKQELTHSGSVLPRRRRALSSGSVVTMDEDC
jgi:hypothetical protein